MPGKFCVVENYSSLEKYFVTFPRRKFSPVLFDSSHILTFYCFKHHESINNYKFKFKTVHFYCFERMLFSVKSFVEGKLVHGENLSMVKINRRGKFSSGENNRHLAEILSLFPDKVFLDKVLIIA